MTSEIVQALVVKRPFNMHQVARKLSLFDEKGQAIDLAGATHLLIPNIVFDGDSQSVIGSPGLSTTEYGDIFPALAASGIDPRATLGTTSLSGRLVLGMIPLGAISVDPLLVAGARNVVVPWAGTNDLYVTGPNNATAAVAYERIVTYHAARRAAGWKTIVFTVLPRTDAGTPAAYEADRLILNTQIRTNWASFADALCDIALDTRLQNSADSRYFADLVHCNLAGRWVVAGHTKKALGMLGVFGAVNPQLAGLVSPAAGKGMVALGESALGLVTTGVDNTAFGRYCLANVTTGMHNIGVGRSAGGAITAGVQNVVVGTNAMLATNTGNNNVAIGHLSLYSNTSSSNNTALGASAAFSATGGDIVAVGYRAAYAPGGLPANTTTTGLRQTNLGTETGQSSAVQRNDTTAVGYRALVGESDATAVGSGAQALHLGSVALGKGSVTTAINQVMVGARDVEITDTTKGVILRSPDGTRYRITVANGGALTAVAVV